MSTYQNLMVRHKQNDGGVCHEQKSPSVSTLPVHLVRLNTTPPFCHELTKGTSCTM